MRAVLVSLSSIEDDPRVRRHGDALAAAGWTVTGVGLSGHRSPPPSWPVVHLPEAAAGWAAQLGRAVRLGAARALPAGAAPALHEHDPLHRALVSELDRLRADVLVANDWPVLPAVAGTAARQGSSYVYDTHEYGPLEFADRWKWRLLFPRYVAALESRYAAGAALTMTVSGQIARRMQDELRLRQAPLVIRNVPAYQSFPLRPVGETVEVLYHGVFAPDRGLEPLLESARDWGPSRRLVLRGLGHGPYVEELRARVEALGHDRVVLAPPAPPDQLVAEASRSDVGLFVSSARPEYAQFLLPNKFFEYVMAGLALCVSDVPEMAALVAEHDLGVLVTEPSAEAITTAVESLDRERIAHHKAQALRAARSLSWEHEQATLVEAFDALR